MTKLRRAGSPWRILAHAYTGGRPKYGHSYHVTNDPDFGRLPPTDPARKKADELHNAHSTTTVLDGTEFDELVIGRWIHLEQMNDRQWWMNIGGVTIWVTADRDGRPRKVTVFGPDDYAEPVDGCQYEIAWTDPPQHTSEEATG